MKPLTEKDWEHYSHFHPAWHSYWFDYDIYHEDLCGNCDGFGKVDFLQFHPSTDCEDCDGTGLKDVELRDRILAVRELRSVDLSKSSIETIKAAAKLLRQKDENGP